MIDSKYINDIHKHTETWNKQIINENENLIKEALKKNGYDISDIEHLARTYDLRVEHYNSIGSNYFIDDKCFLSISEYIHKDFKRVDFRYKIYLI